MVMSTSPTAPPPALAAASTDYARPLGHRLQGKFHRFPLALAGIAIVSLLLPLAQADAAVIEPAARGESIAAQTGLEPAAQQREGRRGGGEFRGNRGGGGGGRDFSRGGGREFRGGGGGREFRAQPRSNIGSARIDTPREFRQERRADQQDFRQDRRGDVQGFRQDRRGDRQDFRQERRSDRQDFRQGDVTRPEFRADRRDDRQDFRQDRRGDRRDFRTDRRDDRRDFRQDRRGDIRDYRDNRRGYSNRGWDGRNWDGRGGRGGNWDRGWRNDRRYDWYGYRNQNRNFYRAGRYFAPVRGWNYRRLGIGFTLGAPFFASSFWINDPWAYRLPPAYGQLRWVRYYGDVLLVDIYTGEVVDVINDFFW
jgi:hypothetical protein